MGATVTIHSFGAQTIPVGQSRSSAGFQTACDEAPIMAGWKACPHIDNPYHERLNAHEEKLNFLDRGPEKL